MVNVFVTGSNLQNRKTVLSEITSKFPNTVKSSSIIHCDIIVEVFEEFKWGSGLRTGRPARVRKLKGNYTKVKMSNIDAHYLAYKKKTTGEIEFYPVRDFKDIIPTSSSTYRNFAATLEDIELAKRLSAEHSVPPTSEKLVEPEKKTLTESYRFEIIDFGSPGGCPKEEKLNYLYMLY